MSAERIDVLAVMDALAKYVNDQTEAHDEGATALLQRAGQARAAVAELIEERERLRLVESCAHILAVHIAGHFALPTDNSKAICLDWSKKTRAALARIGAKP